MCRRTTSAKGWRHTRVTKAVLAVGFALGCYPAALMADACEGRIHQLNYGNGKRQNAFVLSDGSLATYARMSVNVDGMGRAYHRDDVAGAGLISLCNGGKPYPAGGAPYDASRNNEACRRFSQDYRAIREAGWRDPEVGAIHWFGVLGEGSVRIGTNDVKNVVPVEQSDGSGFFVSPTKLEDSVNYPDAKDQRRYIDAGKIPAAVIRGSNALFSLGITVGTFGVAIHRRIQSAVPFIIADHGPRIGEGSFALGRQLKGLPVVAATRRNVFSAHIEGKEVLWIFFGGAQMQPPYTPGLVQEQAKEAFRKWGGNSRLTECLSNRAIPKAN